MLDEARQACRFPEGLVVAEPHRRMTEGASFVRARGVHHVVVVFEIVGRPQKRMTIPTDRRENDRLVALQNGRRLVEQKSDARRLEIFSRILRPFSFWMIRRGHELQEQFTVAPDARGQRIVCPQLFMILWQTLSDVRRDEQLS